MVKMNGGGRANSVGRSVGGDATRTGRVFTQPRPYFAAAVAARELPPAVMTTDLRKRTDGESSPARSAFEGKGVRVGGCGALAGG